MADSIRKTTGLASPYVVELSGDLSIRTIGAVQAHLIEALSGHDTVTASIDPDAQVDLTLVQVIEAARRTCEEDGKSFTLASAAKGALLDVLRRGGFLAERNADLRAFWLAGEAA